MEKEILFSETQKFRQWWIWMLFLVINGIFLYAVYQQIFQEKPFGNVPMSDNALLVATVICLALTWLFINFRLETQIKDDGIYVRFFPFHLTFKHYPWDIIQNAYIREYKPIREYGGWGIRYSISGKGKAFNVSGNIGLQLEMKNSKKLLIGTNKAEEVKVALQKLGRLSR